MWCLPLLSPPTRSGQLDSGVHLFAFTELQFILYSHGANRRHRIAKGAHTSKFPTTEVDDHTGHCLRHLFLLRMELDWSILIERATDWCPKPPDKGVITFWSWTCHARVFLGKIALQSGQECGLWSQAAWFEFELYHSGGPATGSSCPLFSHLCTEDT